MGRDELTMEKSRDLGTVQREGRERRNSKNSWQVHDNTVPPMAGCMNLPRHTFVHHLGQKGNSPSHNICRFNKKTMYTFN